MPVNQMKSILGDTHVVPRAAGAEPSYGWRLSHGCCSNSRSGRWYTPLQPRHGETYYALTYYPIKSRVFSCGCGRPHRQHSPTAHDAPAVPLFRARRRPGLLNEERGSHTSACTWRSAQHTLGGPRRAARRWPLSQYVTCSTDMPPAAARAFRSTVLGYGVAWRASNHARSRLTAAAAEGMNRAIECVAKDRSARAPGSSWRPRRAGPSLVRGATSRVRAPVLHPLVSGAPPPSAPPPKSSLSSDARASLGAAPAGPPSATGVAAAAADISATRQICVLMQLLHTITHVIAHTFTHTRIRALVRGRALKRLLLHDSLRRSNLHKNRHMSHPTGASNSFITRNAHADKLNMHCSVVYLVALTGVTRSVR